MRNLLITKKKNKKKKQNKPQTKKQKDTKNFMEIHVHCMCPECIVLFLKHVINKETKKDRQFSRN